VKGHEFYQVEFETASDPMANANERLGLHMTNKSYQSMSPMTSSNRPLLSQEREKELETLSGTR